MIIPKKTQTQKEPKKYTSMYKRGKTINYQKQIWRLITTHSWAFNVSHRRLCSPRHELFLLHPCYRQSTSQTRSSIVPEQAFFVNWTNNIQTFGCFITAFSSTPIMWPTFLTNLNMIFLQKCSVKTIVSTQSISNSFMTFAPTFRFRSPTSKLLSSNFIYLNLQNSLCQIASLETWTGDCHLQSVSHSEPQQSPLGLRGPQDPCCQQHDTPPLVLRWEDISFLNCLFWRRIYRISYVWLNGERGENLLYSVSLQNDRNRFC